MTTDDALARLTAGLKLDGEVARAAGERAAEWRSDGKGVAGGPFTPAEPEFEITEQGTHTIVYDEGWPLAPEAVHIARQDPRITLLRVEAIRNVIDAARAVLARNDPNLTEAGTLASDVLEGLAGIYSEPTDETSGES